MPIISKENLIGAWTFSIGIIIAIIIGISTSSLLPLSFISTHSSQIYAILIILGLIAGFFIKISNRKDSEILLLSGVTLVIISKFGMESVVGSLIGIGVGNIVTSTFSALVTLFIPVTMIIAIKIVFSLARI